ncbi:hypothetical protein LC55x_1237 [Lysobacter capsici]|nr:hypothetical protein LC55x_1237 [Lysobacter capsici]
MCGACGELSGHCPQPFSANAIASALPDTLGIDSGVIATPAQILVVTQPGPLARLGLAWLLLSLSLWLKPEVEAPIQRCEACNSR